jgi:hypothetical protein
MSVNVGKGLGTSSDIQVPQVTREMLIRTVKIICGLAWSVEDAKFLMDALGIPEDVIVEARRVDGFEFGLV